MSEQRQSIVVRITLVLDVDADELAALDAASVEGEDLVAATYCLAIDRSVRDLAPTVRSHTVTWERLGEPWADNNKEPF